MTNNEQQALHRLREMAANREWTAMELWPPKNDTRIQPTGNRLVINEGRDGEWHDISSTFYDAVVCSFDSREVSYAERNWSVSVPSIVRKFCEGPAASDLSPEAIAECLEQTTLEDLIAILSRHVDFRDSAQAALYVVNNLDYEID